MCKHNQQQQNKCICVAVDWLYVSNVLMQTVALFKLTIIQMNVGTFYLSLVEGSASVDHEVVQVINQTINSARMTLFSEMLVSSSKL